MSAARPTERETLLAQVAGYLEWEEQLGGSGIPRGVPPTREATTEARSVTPAQPAPRPAPSVPPGGLTLAPTETAGERSGLSALALSLPVASGGDARLRLAQLDEQVRACTGCELHKGRRQTVFARGNPESKLVFVGEGPGQEEDRSGQPFVGPAGQLLDKMVAAMGLHRDDVYICNVVKCRPPGNRTPLPSEAGACAPFLLGQIDAIAPKVLVALGRCAAENMGLVDAGTWRGRWGRFRGVEVMPTYHPAFLLRSPEYKRPVWEDLQKVMARLRELG